MPSTPTYMNIGPIPQGGTFRYSGTLVDNSGTAIPAADLLTLTLTLKDLATGTTINSRAAQNVLNANQVTVSSAGGLVWESVGADNAIVGTPSNGQVEQHEAIFRWTWTGTDGVVRTGKRKLIVNVESYSNYSG